jgi:hypothetical protein
MMRKFHRFEVGYRSVLDRPGAFNFDPADYGGVRATAFLAE